MHRKNILSILASLILLTGTLNGLQTELTFFINSKEVICFYQHLKAGLQADVGFFVIQGEELELSFEMMTPSNRMLYPPETRSDDAFMFNTTEHGDYRMCFDNTNSKSKLVNFYVSTGDGYVDPKFKSDSDVYERKKDDIEIGIENLIKDMFTMVEKRLNKIERIQAYFRNSASLDIYLMEEIYDRLNFWAVFHICLMVIACLIQVVFIRSLFENKKFKYFK